METNGLINDTTHIHCIVLHHVEENYTESFNDECPGKGMSSPVIRALQWLELADTIVGHNIIGFDIPVAQSIYHWFNPSGVIVDTLLLSRLYHPNLLDIDKIRFERTKPIKKIDIPIGNSGFKNGLEFFGVMFSHM